MINNVSDDYKLGFAHGYAECAIDFDLVSVVRCKDCKWYTQFRNIKGELFPEGECEGWGFTKPDDFCSRGERKESK